jgi:hypothetical protein
MQATKDGDHVVLRIPVEADIAKDGYNIACYTAIHMNAAEDAHRVLHRGVSRNVDGVADVNHVAIFSNGGRGPDGCG